MAEVDSTDTGTVICPWCWRQWRWYHPMDPNYATSDLNGACPRCGRAIPGMPDSVREIYQLPDAVGYPST